jgi:hypothetical protein
MARTVTEAQKTVSLPIKDLVRPYNGLYDTVFTQRNGDYYVGEKIINGLPTSTALTDLTFPITLVANRITGSYIFDVDASKTIAIVKVGTSISLYEYSSGVAPAAIATLSCSSGNSEVYLEAIFCATEKAVVTGFSKYIFLNLPGEAWVVAYSTRTSSWTYDKLNVTYSAWVAFTNYAVGAKRIPTVSNGYYYEVIANTGSSGATEPTWPTTIGDTVVDQDVTWVCRGRYGNFPTTTSSTVKILNGYIFVAVNGDIYNSDLDLPDSWNPSDFISTEIFPDSVVALAKFKNYLVAFGENTVEFFYDAANATGSPLARQEGILHNIGCIGQGAVTELEDRIFWIAQSGSTYYSIWELDKFEAKKVSTPEFDNILTNYLAQSTSYDYTVIQWQLLTAFRLNGRYFVGVPVLSKLNTNPSFNTKLLVMDLELNVVSEFDLLSTGSLSFCRPFIWKSNFLWLTESIPGPGITEYITMSTLVVNEYDTVYIPSFLLISYFNGTPNVYLKRLDFNSTQYKVLNEIQVNGFPSIGTAYFRVTRDNLLSTTTVYTVPSNSYKIHRLGRAREFDISFTGNYQICMATFKYTEHAN